MLYQTKNPHGGDIYGGKVILDFSANTNPFGTPQGILDAITKALPQLHRYPDPHCRKLAQAIAEFEGVPKDYILCGNGAAELIYSYCEAVSPKVAVELAPTFSEYSLGLARVGSSVHRYELHQENGFELNNDFIDYIKRTMPNVVFLCNPNNPTGKTIHPKLLASILKFCSEQSIRLFVDECFLDLCDGGESLKDFLSDNPQLFILKAFTKSYGMAGVRLGYCLSADSALLMRMAKTVQPWNVSSLAQAAGVAALQEEAFLRKTRDLITRERIWLKAQLESLGFHVCASQVNYLLFQGPENLHTELKKRGITIRNCDNYYGLGPGWFRIAVRLHEENETLIEMIKLICEKV